MCTCLLDATHPASLYPLSLSLSNVPTQADLVEHLCECLRSSLQTQVAPSTNSSNLQRQVVAALATLAPEGAPFKQHLAYGLDSLLAAAEAAAACSDTHLLAALLPLLALCMGPQHGLIRVTAADVRRAAEVAQKVFPSPAPPSGPQANNGVSNNSSAPSAQAAQATALLPDQHMAACAAACELLTSCCAALLSGAGGAASRGAPGRGRAAQGSRGGAGTALPASHAHMQSAVLR